MLTIDFKVGRKEYRVHGCRSVEIGKNYLYLYMDGNSKSPESLYMVRSAKIVRVHASTYDFTFTRPDAKLVLC